MRRVVDIAMGTGKPEIEILITGGEPLLEWEALERLLNWAARDPRSRRRIRFTVTTNGTRLVPEVVKVLADHDVDLQISFDGVRPSQDLRAPETFNRLRSNLGWIRDEMPEYLRGHVQVSAVVTAGNASYLARTVAFFLDLGIHEIRFGPLLNHDPAWSERSERILDSRCRKIVDISLDHARRTRSVPVGFLAQSAPDGAARRPGGATCGAPFPDSLCVDVDGEVYGCHVFARSHGAFTDDRFESDRGAMHFGSIFDHRFPGNLGRRTSPIPELFVGRDRRWSSIGGRCSECPDADTCVPCPAATALIPGNTDPHRVPDSICSFHRVTSKHRREFQRRVNRPREAARMLWPERFAN